MSRTDFFLGTKTTAKDMVKLCDDFGNIYTSVHGGPYFPLRDVQKLLEITDNLTQLHYEEERVEAIIKKIIEQCKQDLINLIKEDEAFTKDEEEAIKILQKLKQNANKLKDELRNIKENETVYYVPVSIIWSNIINLKKLLVKDADIAEAVQVIARDLEKLMQTLRKIEH